MSCRREISIHAQPLMILRKLHRNLPITKSVGDRGLAAKTKIKTDYTWRTLTVSSSTVSALSGERRARVELLRPTESK